MKRIANVFGALAMLFLLVFPQISAVSAAETAASGTCGADAVWQLDSTGVLTVSGKGEMSDAPWQEYCAEIRSAVIAEGITSVADNAFSGCTGLCSVSLPETLKSVGSKAFYNTALPEVSIPAGVTTIGAYAFASESNPGKLKEVRFCGDLPTVAYTAFDNVEADAYYPEGNTTYQSVGSTNFGGLLNWAQLYSGSCGIKGDNVKWELTRNGVLTISGSGAMNGYNSSLTPWDSQRNTIQSVVIQEGVTVIGTSSFKDCTNLTKVSVPNSVNEIGSKAFASCSSLTKVVLPDGVKKIGPDAFSGCKLLSEINLPAGLTSIGEGAFTNCGSLSTITIPAGITRIDAYTFKYCSGLKTIIFKGNAPTIGSEAFFSVSAEIQYSCDATGWDTIGYIGSKVTLQLVHPKDSTVPLDKVEPTCTAAGLTAGSKCNACGDILIAQEPIDKLPHTLGQKHDAKPANYAAAGHIEYYDCSGCDKKLDADGNELTNVEIPKREDEVEWNMRWEGDNIVWDPVEGAHDYSVEVYMAGISAIYEPDVVGTSADVKEIFLDWGTGTYTFRVIAYFDDDYDEYIMSPRSSPKNYVSPVVDLGEPSNAVWDGFVARWDAAEHAEYYIVTLYKVGRKTSIGSVDIEGTECDFTEDLAVYGSGTYYFEVKSFRAHNEKGPAVSKKIEYTAEKEIPIVQNAHWDGHIAKWDPVEGANGYSINFTICGDTTWRYGTTIWGAADSYDLADLLEEPDCGQYSFELAVIWGVSGGGWSEPSDTLDYHKSIQNFPKEDATCTKSGVTAGSKCDACGKIFTPRKTIDKLPHTYDASWVCTVCGDAHTHALGKKHGVKAATDTANGNIEYYDCVGFGDGCDLKLDAEGNELTNVTIPAAKTIKLSSTSCTYNGEVRTPAVTVKAGSKTLVKGTDYTVTYASGRKAVGTYKVVVKGKGDYAFTKTLTFKIIPAKTAISKLTAAQKAFTVKWAKKSAQVGGYQIQYSLKKDFSSGNKLVTVKGMNNVSKTIKNLLAGKTYFVRVRTFKTVDGKNYTSAWSAVKSIKTLK